MQFNRDRRPARLREMDASERKSCRMALLLILLPVVMAVEVDLKSLNPAIIQTAQSEQQDSIDNQVKPAARAFIITARALESEEVQLDTEPETAAGEATEYSTTDETDQTISIRSTTESGLFTSTSAPAYTDEPASTISKIFDLDASKEEEQQQDVSDAEPLVEENEDAEHTDDLNASSTNLDVHHRRSDAEEDDHQVLYARLKHPVRPLNLPDQTETSVGTIFGRPYNARPFVPRFTTTSAPGIIPVRTTTAEGNLFPTFNKRPSQPDLATDLASPDLTWLNKLPNRWEKEKAANQRFNMTRVQSIDAECQNDYMKIRLRFNGSFSGIIYSTGFAYDPLCVYINGTGRDYYEFYIQLNRCGTLGGNTHNLDSRKQPTKNFMWNTLSIQYSSLIEEEWDEHYKMTCEYGYDYWKTVTFPFLDVEVATGNPLTFTLTPPECHMEIRSGYGTTGTRVTGPVRVGDPLTLIVYMRSQFDGFDVIVSDCFAHNGANKKIQLIDSNGCPINEKLISRFRGSWTDSGLYETQVFAYMKAFRFTGSPALYIECDVRMCHGHCPTQPCYWRNSRDITKRDVSTTSAVVNTTLSENLSLFQALQVIADDETTLTDTLNDSNRDSSAVDSEHICLKPVAIGAVLGLASLITIALGIISFILCLRLRRRSQSDSNALYHQHHYGQTSTMDNQYAKKRNFQ